jgi:crotonobetaine/carnitine-CoA ligase
MAIDLTGARRGEIVVDGTTLAGPAAASLPGVARDPLDVAGFMHTSGTTGPPKFCAQSHEYFLRLGRFVARALALTAEDTVLAPLPFFHINPLGYGFIGALTASASVVGLRRFVPETFWQTAKEVGATVLVLHAPPVQVLKARTEPASARGHRVRITFYADLDFLTRYGIPAGVSGYGSTEAAGLTHSWRWKATDAKPDELSEGVSHYGGEARDDIEWAIASDGELRVRGKAPGTIFSGYWRNDRLDPATDTEGWFHTGDLARSDERGNLVFIERRSESIRVRGEFVPIDYVEGQFRGLAGVSDVALWKDAGPSADDVSVLYVVGDEFSVEAIATVAATLPRFMRPSIVVQIGAIPRDEAAGKVRRRLLASVHRVNTWALATMSNRAGS